MSYLARYIARTNVFWNRLEAGWNATQRAGGSPDPLGVCLGGRRGIGSSRLPVTAVFSLPVGLGMHVDGVFHTHWSAMAPAALSEGGPSVKRGNQYYDASLQNTNHWLPQILGAFYPAVRAAGAASGLGTSVLGPGRQDAAAHASSVLGGVVATYSTAAGFEGAGCLCLAGSMAAASHVAVRINSYRSAVPTASRTGSAGYRESSVDVLGHNAYSAIGEAVWFSRPVLPRRGSFIVRMSCVESVGCEVVLRILLASHGHRGISSILLRGKANMTEKNDASAHGGGSKDTNTKTSTNRTTKVNSLEPTWVGLRGDLFFPSSGSTSNGGKEMDEENNTEEKRGNEKRGGEGSAPISRRQWEVREWTVPETTIDALTTRQIIGVEVLLVSKSSSSTKGTKHTEEGHVPHMIERRSVRANIGHITLGALTAWGSLFSLESAASHSGATPPAPVSESLSSDVRILACPLHKSVPVFTAIPITTHGWLVKFEYLGLVHEKTSTTGGRTSAKRTVLPVKDVLIYGMPKWAGDEDDKSQWTLVARSVVHTPHSAGAAIVYRGAVASSAHGALALRLVPRTACLTPAQFSSCPVLYIESGGEEEVGNPG